MSDTPSTQPTEAYASPRVSSEAVAENEFQYRTISKAAVASVAFAVLGLGALVFKVFVLLPVLAIGFGIVAIMEIGKYPDEITGKLAAQIGLGCGLLIAAASISLHTYVHLTEVPDGYTRVAFSDLRPNLRTVLPFSEKSQELDGKKVFLKGYVRPNVQMTNMKDFILVGDFGDCCFGGNPKITEVVAVNIKTDDLIDHSYFLRKIGGTFRLDSDARRIDEDGIPRVFYSIEADYIR